MASLSVSQDVMHKLRSTRVRLLVDPVYSNTRLEPYQYQVLNMPAFQRLGRVRQNGPVVYVYPSSTHTRLAHCLGVGHLAGIMYDHIVQNQPEVARAMHPTDRKLVVTAGMVHDLGHAPFSHLFETFSHSFGGAAQFHHESMSMQLLRRACEQGRLPFLDEATEPGPNDDDALLTTDVQRRERRLRVIECLITGSPVSNGDLPPAKHWILDVVSNQFSMVDVDRLDYLERDSQTIFGCGRSPVNLNRILLSARVIGGHLCFHRNVAYNLYQLLKWRADLHFSVYTHHTVLAAETMICDILALIYEPLRLSECLDPDRFVHFDDSILQVARWKAREMPGETSLQKAVHLMDRLEQRQFYTLLAELRLEATERTTRLGKDRFDALRFFAHTVFEEMTTGLPASNSLQLVVKFVHHGGGADNPIGEAPIFYDDDDGQRSDRTGAFALCPDEVSHLLPKAYGEYVVCLFTRDLVSCPEHLPAIRQKFQQALQAYFK